MLWRRRWGGLCPLGAAFSSRWASRAEGVCTMLPILCRPKATYTTACKVLPPRYHLPSNNTEMAGRGSLGCCKEAGVGQHSSLCLVTEGEWLGTQVSFGQVLPRSIISFVNLWSGRWRLRVICPYVCTCSLTFNIISCFHICGFSPMWFLASRGKWPYMHGCECAFVCLCVHLH